MTRKSENPIVTVNARGAARLRGGHPWVYRSDMASANGIPPGSVVTVVDSRSRPLATALYSSASQIAIRAISQELIPAREWNSLLRKRISEAVAFRRRAVRDSDACRVVFSEADFLPGLIVDKYGDYLSLQVLTQAMDTRDARNTVIGTLVSELSPIAIFERVEPRIRELEQMEPRQDSLIWSRLGGEVPPKTTFTMNGLRFLFDTESGQKTGAFLDQRENYAAAERYASGRALDCFTYQGGFALHLNRACEQVTAVDVSRAALESAEQNWKMNEAAFNARDIEWIEANAFDLLRDYADRGEKYDIIVLDPPAFAKTKSAAPKALGGYKELNLRAMKMLGAGGKLITCSCSYHVSESDFLDMLASAAADAHRPLRVLGVRRQSQDHPILLNVPETHYLKCVICEAL
ncbi:MAG TPA: class I SAM-dependent rRNA methyltransferase [Terriglobales bacterium]|nr:class I SAM-dependent rRNA methyltransferase [Terriglobales bacterium]